MGKDLIDHLCSKRGYIKLNSFWGGERCVQLTTPLPDGYAQMTFEEAKSFFKECIDVIERTEKEYDENTPWWESIAKIRN